MRDWCIYALFACAFLMGGDFGAKNRLAHVTQSKENRDANRATQKVLAALCETVLGTKSDKRKVFRLYLLLLTPPHTPQLISPPSLYLLPNYSPN